MSAAEKTLQLLKLLSKKPYKHSVTSLSEQMGYTKSAVYKLLTVLVDCEMATKDSNKLYSLGPETYFLGRAYEEFSGITTIIKPYLEELSNKTLENISISIFVNGNSVLLSRVEGKKPVSVIGNIGEQRSLHAGASGKLLGAFQSKEMIEDIINRNAFKQYTPNTISNAQQLREEYAKIRQQNFAVSNRELTKDTIGLAAPVFMAKNKIWAAISIAAPADYLDSATIEKYLRLLDETAKAISSKIFNY